MKSGAKIIMLKKVRRMNRKWRTYSKFHYRRIRLWLKIAEEGMKAEAEGDMEKAMAIMSGDRKAIKEISKNLSC